MRTFFWPARVYYEDTDAGGVVFHANYLRFMERARTEWLRALGYVQDALIQERGVLFAVRSVAIDYRRPAYLDDLLHISANPKTFRHASMTFEQPIIRASESGDGPLLAYGTVKVACLDAETFRPRPLPRELTSGC